MRQSLSTFLLVVAWLAILHGSERAQSKEPAAAWGHLRGRFWVGNDGLANVVLFVTSKSIAIHPDYAARADGRVQMEVRDRTFVPHVLSVRVSQPMEFKNLDVVAHNVNVAPLGDLAINPLLHPGSSVTHGFRKAQRTPVRVTSAIYPEMLGWVVVRDNPYVAVSEADGGVELRNLPVGELDFRAWHEDSGWLKVHPEWNDKGEFRMAIKSGENDLGTIRVGAKAPEATLPIDPFRPRMRNKD